MVGTDVMVVTNNHFFVAIDRWRSQLYAINETGRLFFLANHPNDSSYWIWKLAKWAPVDIVRVSVTLDDQHMWIETTDKSYLFNQKLDHKTYGQSRRVYGINKSSYLEFVEQECKIVVNDQTVKTVTGIASGVMNSANTVYLLTVENTINYKNVRLLNHQPYYIKRL